MRCTRIAAHDRRMNLFALTFLTMVAFAANSVLNRLALIDGGMDPAAFALIRLMSGAVVLAGLVALRQGGGLSALRIRPVPALMLATYVLGFSFAYVTLDAGVGALILFGGVQITMFAGAMLARETIPRRRWIGALIAFGGLVWLFWPGGATRPDLTGALLMGGAALGWGVYSIRGKHQADALGATAANFLWASPVAIAVFLISGHWGQPMRGAFLALVSGIVTSGFGYALWYSVLPRIPASLAAVAQLTVPLIAMAGGAVFLGESLTLRFVVSGLLVLGGVGLSLTGSRR